MPMLMALSLEREQGASSREIASVLKLHPFVADKILKQAHRFSPGVLERTMDELAQIDVRMKSTGVSGALLLEGLVFRLCIP